jgi:hypothetical protein
MAVDTMSSTKVKPRDLTEFMASSALSPSRGSFRHAPGP